MSKNYRLIVEVEVSLPDEEKMEEQDITLLLTGDNWNPWPGVEIVDMKLRSWWPGEL
jgi:hypothetical protein